MNEPSPTFEDARSNAFAMLGDVEDELRTGWREGTGPRYDQVDALLEARQAIANAKAALDRAGRAAR
jgi:hypothetical protein